MTLPEADESTFDLFVEWLYHQRYDLPSHLKANGKRNDRFMQPFQLYVLADNYGIRSLKSHIVSQIFTAFKQDADFQPGAATVYAYENTSQSSTIRKLIADRLACSNNLGWFQRESSQKWLRDHADITTDVLISHAKHARIQRSPFDGEMPEDYKEKELGMGRGNELVSNITSWTVPGERHILYPSPSPTTLQLSTRGSAESWRNRSFA